jgi:hypothetical protein
MPTPASRREKSDTGFGQKTYSKLLKKVVAISFCPATFPHPQMGNPTEEMIQDKQISRFKL